MSALYALRIKSGNSSDLCEQLNKVLLPGERLVALTCITSTGAYDILDAIIDMTERLESSGTNGLPYNAAVKMEIDPGTSKRMVRWEGDPILRHAPGWVWQLVAAAEGKRAEAERVLAHIKARLDAAPGSVLYPDGLMDDSETETLGQAVMKFFAQCSKS